MIEILVAIYLIFLGVTVSLSAKSRTRFLIGIELQVLGIVLLALIYSYAAPVLGILVVLAIVLEAIKLSAAVGLKE